MHISSKRFFGFFGTVNLRIYSNGNSRCFEVTIFLLLFLLLLLLTVSVTCTILRLERSADLRRSQLVLSSLVFFDEI